MLRDVVLYPLAGVAEVEVEVFLKGAWQHWTGHSAGSHIGMNGMAPIHPGDN